MPSLLGTVLRLERAVGKLEASVGQVVELDQRLTRVERTQWMLAGAWVLAGAGWFWTAFGGPQHDQQPVLATDPRRETAEVRPVPVR